MKKDRILSLILSVMMIFSLVFPAGIFAEELDSPDNEAAVEETVAESGSSESADEVEQDDEALWAAADCCPVRADFVRIWRESKGLLHIGSDVQAILDQCPDGMLPETYCICLIALMEAGLLRSTEGGIFGAQSVEIEGKADLEATPILQSLRSMS